LYSHQARIGNIGITAQPVFHSIADELNWLQDERSEPARKAKRSFLTRAAEADDRIRLTLTLELLCYLLAV
jgi:hypothetical protein